MGRAAERHRRTAERFSATLLQTFPAHVRAVILYGSVARGRPHRESDIDVLVLVDDRWRLFDPIQHLAFEAYAADGYRNRLSSHLMTVDGLRGLLEIGSPFAENVRDEGIVLYDDGAYESVRETVPIEE